MESSALGEWNESDQEEQLEPYSSLSSGIQPTAPLFRVGMVPMSVFGNGGVIIGVVETHTALRTYDTTHSLTF
jgi:hypothetical protein